MKRHLLISAVLLIAITPTAMARRRAVTPGPLACQEMTLLPSTYGSVLALDDQFLYVIDESAALIRVPKLGGEPQLISNELDQWFPLAMEVDETTIYISALPIESIFLPSTGSLLAIPKDGGVVTVLASGVATAFGLAIDDTHVYWAAAGIFDFLEGTISPGGKIERVRKDGSERMTLADDLSAPLALILDGNNVYFGESGLADGDDSFGLYRVAKSGGAATEIRGDVAVAALALDGTTLVFPGVSETTGVGLLAVETNGSGLRLLSSDDSIGFTVHVADRQAYTIAEHETYELLAINIDDPGADPVVRRSDLDGEAFLIDGCAAIVNTADGNIIRTPR